jgi:hypothetical protein
VKYQCDFFMRFLSSNHIRDVGQVVCYWAKSFISVYALSIEAFYLVKIQCIIRFNICLKVVVLIN